VEEGCNIAKELYVGLVVDRSRQRVAVMACEEGGVEIEEVAARSPEKIIREFIDPAVGIQGFQARKLAFGLGPQTRQGASRQGRWFSHRPLQRIRFFGLLHA
jgi:succinyl-CoA synthetase beta subunit